eukprot:TRINITY_DN5372_c0_g1_i1.p3 TRINITY_DN5372_c0_g1~~TRINITY_DN5372_c0_g1_i1.p3  ORF type:complete len:102 (-),score=21.46 TRINITY_DN5372_c0_g1_i1:78-383(-)
MCIRDSAGTVRWTGANACGGRDIDQMPSPAERACRGWRGVEWDAAGGDQAGSRGARRGSGGGAVLLQRARGAAGDGTGSSCLLYTSPSPRDRTRSRMPSSA